MRRTVSGLLIAAFALSGCATLGMSTGGGETSEQADLPAWVKSPPSDSPFDLYGIGEGRSLSAAKNAALSNIAGKLNTWVQSSTKGSSTKYAGETSRSFRKDIQTRIQGLKLSNYQVQKTAERGSTTLVLLRVDREAVFRDTRSRLEDLDQEIARTFREGGDAPLVGRFAAYQGEASRLAEAKRLVYTLEALDSEFDEGSYLDRYRNYRKTLNEVRGELKVRVNASENTRLLAERMVSQLVDKGVTAGMGGSVAGANGVIRLRDRVEKEELFGSQTVKLRVWAAVADRRGQEVAKVDFQETGSSPSGYPVALESANRKLSQSMKEQGILHALHLAE
jgi:hypothetical protein